MGLGGTYRSEENFKVIIWGVRPQRVGTILIVGIDPSRHQVKIFIWQLEDVKLGEMAKKWDRKSFVFHVINPALYPFC